MLKFTGIIRNLFPIKIYRGPVQPAVGPYIWRLTFTGQRPGAHLHDTFTRKLDGQPCALSPIPCVRGVLIVTLLDTLIILLLVYHMVNRYMHMYIYFVKIKTQVTVFNKNEFHI